MVSQVLRGLEKISGNSEVQPQWGLAVIDTCEHFANYWDNAYPHTSSQSPKCWSQVPEAYEIAIITPKYFLNGNGRRLNPRLSSGS
jgi:hypothetical protein